MHCTCTCMHTVCTCMYSETILTSMFGSHPNMDSRSYKSSWVTVSSRAIQNYNNNNYNKQ